MKCSQEMKINSRMLPVKASYFFTLGGVASLLPYLAIYMKQVGLTPIEASITYGLMPFIGAIVRPLIGAVADKLHAHKIALMLCCIFSGVFFTGLLFIPHRDPVTNGANKELLVVDFHCNGTSRHVRYCPESETLCQPDVSMDASAATAAYLSNNSTSALNSIRNCRFECNWSSSTTWLETVCSSTSTPPNVSSQCGPASHQGLQDMPITIPEFHTIEFEQTDNGTQSCVKLYFEELQFNNVSFTECPEVVSESCNMSCEQGPDICDTDSDSAKSASSFDATFWYSMVFMLGANIAFSPIFSLIDAMTYDYLGEDRGNWGKQRLWGTIGFAVFAVISGLSMDAFTESDSEKKNYTAAFVLYAALSFLAAICVWLYKISPELTCGQVLRNVGQVLKTLRAISLLLLTFVFGVYTGLIETFLYWHLSTLGASQLLFGLAMLVNCLPEVPILFLAGKIINKLGHVNILYIAQIAYAVRLSAYAFLVNPWLVLLIEPLHGLTFGLMYAGASSYASLITPPGMHGVMQGLLGGIHFGLGKGCGSLLSGPIYQHYGANTFLFFGISSLLFLLLHICLYVTCINRLEPLLNPRNPELDMKGRGFGSLISGPVFQSYGGKATFLGFGLSSLAIFVLDWSAQTFVISRLEPLETDDKENMKVSVNAEAEKETMLNGSAEGKPDAAADKEAEVMLNRDNQADETKA